MLLEPDRGGSPGGSIHTEGPEGVSAPQVATLDRAEVTISQVEWCAVLSVARDVRRVARVPPWVCNKRADGRHRGRFQETEERLLAQQHRRSRQ